MTAPGSSSGRILGLDPSDAGSTPAPGTTQRRLWPINHRACGKLAFYLAYNPGEHPGRLLRRDDAYLPSGRHPTSENVVCCSCRKATNYGPGSMTVGPPEIRKVFVP